MKKIIVAQLVALLVLTGCTSAPSTKDVKLEDIHTAIKEAYGEDYIPNMEFEAEFLEMEFGLTSDLYDEVIAELSMMSMHVDRLLIVRAKEGSADKVEELLNEARDRKIEDTFAYPMNIARLNATQVVRQGDIMAFMILGAYPADDVIDEEVQIKFAKDEIQKGVDAFNSVFKQLKDKSWSLAASHFYSISYLL